MCAGLLFALTAVLARSFGSVLQKRGVPWIGYKGRKDRRFLCFLSLWTAGFILSNGAVVLDFLALGYLDAATLAALTSLSIVLTVVLAGFFLNERLSLMDYLLTLVITLAIAGIVLLRSDAEEARQLRVGVLVPLSLLPLPGIVVLGVRIFLHKKSGPHPMLLRTVLASLFAGFADGVLIVVMKGLRIELGDPGFHYFSHYLLYLYILAGLMSTAGTQIAYKSGDVSIFVPVFFVSALVYRVFGAFAVFGVPVRPLEILLYVILIAAVFPIVWNHRHALSVGNKEGSSRDSSGDVPAPEDR